MAKSNDNKKDNNKKKKDKGGSDNVAYGVNTTELAGKMIQGRSFLTFGFFKRNMVYVIAITVMLLMYISNKYTCQNSLSQVMKLTEELNNAKTDCVNASAQYNSMIRESQMTAYIDSMHIDLTSPDQPPFYLTDK